MDWSNIVDIFKMENLIYWIVTMVVVILTTIRQFSRQEKNNQNKKLCGVVCRVYIRPAGGYDRHNNTGSGRAGNE